MDPAGRAAHRGNYGVSTELTARTGSQATLKEAALIEGPFLLRPIGWVSSPLVDPAAAPKQGDEGSPEAWLLFDEAVREGLRDLRPRTDVVVLTWLHRARRDLLVVHPRDDPANAQQGVFTTRSADRPNPIGIHQVHIVAIDGTRILVRNLEAVDGTPVVDVKPVLGPRHPAGAEPGSLP